MARRLAGCLSRVPCLPCLGCLQMRADRKAAVEVSGAVDEEEEEEELDDSFYPTKLPSRWESQKRGDSSLTVRGAGTVGWLACG